MTVAGGLSPHSSRKGRLGWSKLAAHEVDLQAASGRCSWTFESLVTDRSQNWLSQSIPGSSRRAAASLTLPTIHASEWRITRAHPTRGSCRPSGRLGNRPPRLRRRYDVRNTLVGVESRTKGIERGFHLSLAGMGPDRYRKEEIEAGAKDGRVKPRVVIEPRLLELTSAGAKRYWSPYSTRWRAGSMHDSSRDRGNA